jgi:hypothetical protein
MIPIELWAALEAPGHHAKGQWKTILSLLRIPLPRVKAVKIWKCSTLRQADMVGAVEDSD